jgi:hypothetical protein
VSSSSDRERQLEQEIADLRAAVVALRHDVADLRASALLWMQLYAEAMRRLAEPDREKP